MADMTLRGASRLSTRWKKAIAGIACLTVISASYAGWSIHRATDTTLVKPIVLPVDLTLQTGDIIVAGGVSLQSRIVLAMSDNNRYSHVGMIQVTPQGLFVIHAAPNGAGDGGVGDRVARIPLSLFLAERGYVAVQVMRLNAFTEDAKQLAQDACNYAYQCAKQAVPFDNDFDLDEQDRMYCSELVYLAYQHAGLDWPDTIIRRVSTALKKGPIIAPDAFTQCDAFETIWQQSSEREQS